MVWQNIEGLKLQKHRRRLQSDGKRLYDLYYSELLNYQQHIQSKKVKRFIKEKLKMKATKSSDFMILAKGAKERLVRRLKNAGLFLHEED